MKLVDPRSCTGLLIAAALAGCGADAPLRPADPREVRRLAPGIEGDARAAAASANRFALDLYARRRAEPGNLFFSPYSVATAFAMVHAGAAGGTAAEIAEVFHFDLPPERLHPAFGALRVSLERGAGLGGYELRTANRAWGQRGHPFLRSYLDVTRDHYGAELETADFSGAPDAARSAVNGWVEDRTQRRIRDLFPSGSIDRDTRLVLANATYFKGRWAREFDRSRTREAPFHLGDGSTVSVPTMIQTATFRHAATADAAILELPYRGGDLAMVVILPARRGGLADLEAALDSERLEGWLRAPLARTVEVRLPRFRFGAKFPLGRALADLGMPSAFDPQRADFSGIDGTRDLSISAALHEAFVAVDEEGTEAAAATGVGMGVVSVPPSFVADHPFLFLIRDDVTGSILFLGRVVDPRP